MRTCKNIHCFLMLGVALAVCPLAAPAQTYTWSTIAGLGGTSGTNDGTGNAARFLTPTGVTVDQSGIAYVADYGNATIRKLAFDSGSTNWIVTTIAGSVGKNLDSDGTNNKATFDLPSGIAADSGTPPNLYISDQWPNIRSLKNVSGNVWQSSIVSGFPALGGNVEQQPFGIAVDGAGNVVFTAIYVNNVEKAVLQSASWTVSVIAGDGSNFHYSGSSDSTNWLARFNAPNGAGVDSLGNIFVADTGNNTIRKLAPIVNTTNWIVTTIAGQAGITGFLDGTNTAALFNSPDGLAVDSSGNLFVSDANNNAIRKLTAQGTNWIVTSIGGSMTRNYGTNDGVGVASRFNHPAGLAVDNLGRVFVADYQNNTIRMGVPPPATNPPPSLQLATGGGAAFVMWPCWATGYVLQTSTNLNVGPWVTVVNGITTNFVFAGPMTNAQTFYRLQLP